MKNHYRPTAILIMLLALSNGMVQAQPDPDVNVDSAYLVDFTVFPRTDPYASDNIIKMSLEFDMKMFIRTKHKGEYQKALLTVYLDSNRIQKEIRIRARGVSRRSICYLPPIKLNFKNSGPENDSLNDINSLKLVTHCKNSALYEQYLLKEFLVYRMYNLVTDSSFRVKLLQIEYLDSQGKVKPVTKYGFIIESNDRLAERLNGIRIERSGVNTWDTDTYHTSLTALFQYMIGNTDWAIPVPHNFKLIKPAEISASILAVPYDFDYSGMVNTVYAVPDENLGIETVRTRVYRGYCLSSEDRYRRLFNMFISSKQAMFSLVEDLEYLDKKSRREMLEYLEEFYETIENPRMAKSNIIDQCRPLPR